jgi:hypothetical protein
LRKRQEIALLRIRKKLPPHQEEDMNDGDKKKVEEMVKGFMIIRQGKMR